MLVSEGVHKSARLGALRNLRRYTSGQAASINAYRRLFESASSWKTWVEDTLRDMLEIPSGRRLEITQSSQVHADQTQKYTFEQQEISIGRAPDNDIPLPLRSISRRHARIVERENGFYIEDMKSSSGTYVNRQWLEPAHPRRLAPGDEVVIFPYALRVNPEEIWARDTDVEIAYSCRITPNSTSEFVSSLGSDLCFFQFRLHPEMDHVVIALARPFLNTILTRLTHHTISELADADSGLFEFVVVSILERANRELRFPFQCLLLPGNRFALENKPGVVLEAAVHLTQAHGSILLFLPDTYLHKLENTVPIGLPAGAKDQMTWRAMVRVGFVDLDASDLDDLDLGDTLLYTRDLELVLPAGVGGQVSEIGWRVGSDENNPRNFAVKEFFERSAYMEKSNNLLEGVETSGKVELAALPVRIHVVLSQVELSLRDLEGLTDGSIIQLDEEQPEAVQLVMNGRVLGAGELVEIDHRLGVQITRWRKA